MKPAFKQTNVGMIPEDWEVKVLPDVCRFRGGKAHEQYISEAGPFVCVNSKFISTDGKVRKHSSANFCAAKRNDVLMVMSDLPNGRALAKAYLVEQDDLYAVNQRVCALTAYRDCPEYLFYVLNRNPYFLKFDDGVSQTHLLNHVFEKCQLPMPPTVDEQRAIAGALSDVDALLRALSQLIAKKRDLKQAAMQQLLTGHTRLPGFHAEWDMKQFGEVAFPRRDRVDPRRTGVHEFCVELEHIASASGNLLGSTSTSGQSSLKSVFHPGDVLFGKLRAYLRKYWLVTRSGVCSTEVWVLTPKDRLVTTEFLFQLIKTDEFIEAASNSYGTHMPRSDWNIVKNYEVAIPPLPEQTAIAAVLGEMDTELAGLEQRREKFSALKQAMMQELLTGKTRLV
ncbi:MAG TPA: restriction endonuclease subunit S [Acidobacteriaceae bacterium]